MTQTTLPRPARLSCAKALTLGLAALALAGCGWLPSALQRGDAAGAPDINVTEGPGEDVLRPAARPGGPAAAAPLRPTGRTADALDRTTEAERAAARAAAARPGGAALGETLAGLGAPGEGGFWLRTGLVREARQGRVVAPSGESVGLELRPSGREPGSGSEISLAALRALDLPLTQLATLQVFASD